MALSKRDILELIEDSRLQHIPMETRPLDQDVVDKHLETVRARLALNFGVTLQQDHSGAWGSMGARYLTLRFHDDTGDLITVSMQVKRVSSFDTDDREHSFVRCPQ